MPPSTDTLESPRPGSLLDPRDERQVFASVLSQTPLGVMVLRLVEEGEPGSLTIVYANPAMRHVSNFEFHRFVGQRLDVCMPGAVAVGRAKLLADVLVAGEPRVFPAVHYDPDQLGPGIPGGWFETRAFPVGPGLLGIMTENVTVRTEQAHALENLAGAFRERTAQLVRSNEDLEQFARAVAHELRAPMQPLMASAELLQLTLGDGDARVARLLSGMQQSVERLDKMLSDMLAFAQVDALPGAGDTVSLRASVDEALADLAATYGAAGAEVEVLGDFPPVRVRGSLLTRVFNNLLGNALKFRSDRPLRVRVVGTRDGLAARVEVHDNGLGIAEGEEDAVFELFARGTRARERAGTGMGLALCRRIVTRHGGSLVVSRVPTGGCCFTLTLPAG